MDAQPHPSEALEWARPLIERQLQMLGRLAEAGLEIAIAIEHQAKSPGTNTPVVQGDIALAYARVSRAVRMTIALQAKLIEDLQAWETDAEVRQDNARFEREQARKVRIERIVDRVIKAEVEDQDAVERLSMEASERLDDEDLYGDVMARPFSDIIADICRDLRLNPDWERLMQEPWALEELNQRPPSFAAAKGGGGPSAERSEEPMVEGAGQAHHRPDAQSNPPCAGPPPPPLRGPPPP